MHLLSGATMLGAFFILTDPVTASTTNRGRLIFGALAGLLVWLIRSFGGYPDGVAFAVLLANITVPLIDYLHAPARVRPSLRSRHVKTMRKHGVTLALFAAASTGLTAAIHQLTKSTIAEQAVQQQKALFDQVLPGDIYNNDLQKSCYLVDARRWGKAHIKSILPAKTIRRLRGDGSDGARRLFRRHSAAGGADFPVPFWAPA
jgi:hypothetical protein